MTRLINTFIAVISLLTATGVFIHDGRLDKAATTSAGSAVVGGIVLQKMANGAPDLSQGTDPHTHPDRGAGGLLRGFAYQSPSMPPREQKTKRYMMQNFAPRGRHAFDNYNLPIVA